MINIGENGSLAMSASDKKGPLPSGPEVVTSVDESKPEVSPGTEAIAGQAETDQFFAELEAELRDVPEVVIRDGAERMISFLKGELSWSEIMNLTPETMQRITEFGYLQLQSGRLEDAERVFKVLTMLDWNVNFFHATLGSIYQQQNRPGEAIVQYGEAIKLNPHDGMSMVNRAAIYLKYGFVEQARSDLEAAMAVPGDGKEPWRGKAKQSHQRLLAMLKAQQVKSKAKPTEHSKKGKA